MKKVFLFFLTVSALMATDINQRLESYTIGCVLGIKSMDFRDDFVKVEQACSDCIKGVPITGIDKTDDNVKFMVSKCVEQYKVDRKQ